MMALPTTCGVGSAPHLIGGQTSIISVTRRVGAEACVEGPAQKPEASDIQEDNQDFNLRKDGRDLNSRKRGEIREDHQKKDRDPLRADQASGLSVPDSLSLEQSMQDQAPKVACRGEKADLIDDLREVKEWFKGKPQVTKDLIDIIVNLSMVGEKDPMKKMRIIKEIEGAEGRRRELVRRRKNKGTEGTKEESRIRGNWFLWNLRAIRTSEGTRLRRNKDGTSPEMVGDEKKISELTGRIEELIREFAEEEEETGREEERDQKDIGIRWAITPGRDGQGTKANVIGDYPKEDEGACSLRIDEEETGEGESGDSELEDEEGEGLRNGHLTSQMSLEVEELQEIIDSLRRSGEGDDDENLEDCRMSAHRATAKLGSQQYHSRRGQAPKVANPGEKSENTMSESGGGSAIPADTAAINSSAGSPDRDRERLESLQDDKLIEPSDE